VGIPDYYAALDVDRNVTPGELKRAYRKMVISHHPDRHGGDAVSTERFQRIVEAYSVLSEPEKRARYDAGHLVQGIRFEKGGNFREFVGGFFDGVFGVRAKRKMRGYDHVYRLALSLAEGSLGTSKKLELPVESTCVHCSGRGFEIGVLPDLCERCDGLGELRRRKIVRSEVEDCPDCAGRGYTLPTPCASCLGHGTQADVRQVVIEVPAGVETGEKLLIRGAGQPGWQGGENGDCWVHVTVKRHPHLKRDGTTLHCERPITVFQALSGGKMDVPTLGGIVRIKIPPLSLHGPALRMPGYGAQDPESGTRGDQLVHLQVEIPAALKDEDFARLKALEESIGKAAFPKTSRFEKALGQDPEDE
jgi:molecular chaperone DnaJ